MQQIPLLALQSSKCGIGKFFSSTKLKTDWHLVLNNELLTITVFDSKIPKTVRIAINDIQIVETKYLENAFKIRLLIGKDEFYFLKKDDTYDLAINRTSFKKLPSTQDTKVDEKIIAQLPKFDHFRVKIEDNCYVVYRESTAKNNRHEIPNAVNLESPKNETIKRLNDSFDLYQHNFYFISTEEPGEDFGLVRFVNVPI